MGALGRGRLLVALMGGGAAVTSAWAQGPESVDEIVVTGTRIPRQDLIAASPVSTFDRADIKTQGATVVEDFLNRQPQVQPDFDRTSNNPGDGTAGVNLRGLGRGRTLVLINGRRVAPTGTGSAIDANAIPAAMIERVEIVTGGASAVYGSDAVTGAVNFITRKDFTGIEAEAQADVFGAGDGASYAFSLAGGTGFADGRGHVAVFGDFLEREAVFQGDRDFTAVVLNETALGGLTPAGSPIIPAGRTLTGGPSLVFNPDGSLRPFVSGDLFNFAPANYLQTPLTRWSAGAFASFEAADGVELYAEIIHSRPESATELAAAAAVFPVPLVIDAPFFAASARPTLTARYDPDGDGRGSVVLSKRFEDVGSRLRASERRYWRTVLGVNADIGGGWSLDVFYSYGRNGNREGLDNAVSRARVQQGVNVDPLTGACIDPSNGCVPVNIFGAGVLSPEARDFINVDGLENRFQAIQHNAAIIATGDLFSWAQGDVKGSFGAELRRNAASSDADPSLATGDALGFNSFAGAEGAFTVSEGFGELVVPVLADAPFAERVELEFGGRFSHYSTAGGVFTWKAGGTWRATRGLRFSGVWQRAVRAPNIDELFTRPVTNIANIPGPADYCAAINDPVGAGLADICIAQGMSPAALGVYNPGVTPGLVFEQTTSGNPDLGPERAGTIAAGFDYTFDTPHTIRIGADYFAIVIADAIVQSDRPLSLCPLVADANDPACTAVRRAPSGDVLSLEAAPRNIAEATAKGFDFTFDAAADLPAFGEDVSGAVRVSATHYLELGQRQASGAPLLDCAGGYHIVCGAADTAGTAFPRTLAFTSVSVTKARLTAGLRWRYVGEVENLEPVVTALSSQTPLFTLTRAASRNYLDLSASYRLGDAAVVRAGVDNILKTDPPLLGNQQTQANTDPSRYDVFGRRLFVGLTVSFGQPSDPRRAH